VSEHVDEGVDAVLDVVVVVPVEAPCHGRGCDRLSDYNTSLFMVDMSTKNESNSLFMFEHFGLDVLHART